MTAPHDPSQPTTPASPGALAALVEIRKEKWESIRHADEMDLRVIKSVFAIVGIAMGGNMAFERFHPGLLSWPWLAGVALLVAFVCWFGAASMARNYVVYLRALDMITELEREMRGHGLELQFGAHSFRSPSSIWSFLSKFVRTTRFAYMVLYVLAALGSLAVGVHAWVDGSRLPNASVGESIELGGPVYVVAALLFALTLVFMLYWHWLAYDRVDSAGVLVLVEVGSEFRALLLVGHDNRVTLTKGHRRWYERARDCACRELREETGIVVRPRQLTRLPLVTVSESEPMPGHYGKRVRLWAVKKGRTPRVRVDKAHREALWVSLGRKEIEGLNSQARGPHVAEVLETAASHLRLGECGHVVADV